MKSLEFITVDEERRKQVDQPVTEQERSELRSLLGSLQWLCQQSRIDITVAVNKTAQRITSATVRDLLNCNAIAKRVLETPTLGIVINRGNFDFKNYMVVSFADAAFASGGDVKSQCGELTVVCQKRHVPLISKGRYDLCSVISWKSATIKRVVRSTLAAEGYAVSEAAEQSILLKQVLAECLKPPGVRLSEVERAANADINTVYTDSGSLSDTVLKDTGRCADKRFKIVVAMLRQAFERDRAQLKWADTKQMLADGLTKILTPLWRSWI